MDISDLDDSLFDCSSTEEKKKRVDVSQVKYEAKRCELNWFSDPGLDSESDFMLLKYRGDLLYLQRQYSAAVACYESSLRAVPPGKSVVVRELRESIARSRLCLKQPQEGLDEAYQLVKPPHEKDSSAWKLIADCQGALDQTPAQVTSLQKCASHQRHQFNYWTGLSAAYALLSRQYSREGGIDWIKLQSIINTTVTLFRPYFSWLPLFNKSSTTAGQHVHSNACCDENCALKDDYRAYTEAVVAVVAEGGSQSLCLAHLPFPVVCSGSISGNNVVSMMKTLDHLHFTRELVCSFLLMAECTCLLWARQLLLYFVRYSRSFVAPAHQSALTRVDQLLLTCDQATRLFLETYFNKNRVFEESQNKEDKEDH